MAGEEKFGYFGLHEGTEGEEESFISGCGWLSSCVCGIRNWLRNDLVLFVKKVGKLLAFKEVVGVVEGDMLNES